MRCDWIPPVVVTFLISGVGLLHSYVVTTLTTHLPWLPQSQHLEYALPFWFALACVFASLVQVHFTSAGTVPTSRQLQSIPMRCVESKGNGCRRYCRKCNQWKPDRAHHCYTCGVCTLRLDHHCGILGNCIGYYNHKFFLLFLFWAGAAGAFACYTTYKLDILQVFEHARSTPVKIMMLLDFILMAAFALVLLGFFFFQFVMVAKGYTTIEFAEKRKQLRNGKGYQHLYALSLYRTLQSFLGVNPLLWFLPVRTRLPGDGYDYPLGVETNVPGETQEAARRQWLDEKRAAALAAASSKKSQ